MKLYQEYGSFKKDNGYYFKVYVPNVDNVMLNINGRHFKMQKDGDSWFKYIEGIKDNTKYCYYITKGSSFHNKADPFSKIVRYEKGEMFSYTYNSSYTWKSNNVYNKKTENMKILEVLIEELPGLNYDEKTKSIINLLKNKNFTHVEIMPVFTFFDRKTMGYKPDSFFAIDSKFGTPDDFKKLVDNLHEEGYGVLIDFPMMEFDCIEIKGTLHNFNFEYLFNKGRGVKHPVYTGYYMDFNKKYVREFLLSSINHLKNEFRVDGFRFDGINEIIFEHGNNGLIKEEELKNMRDLLSKIDDTIIILENITSVHKDELMLPNVSIVEGSLWMYDMAKLMVVNPKNNFRSNIPLNLMYEKKKHLFHQDFISCNIPHDMFLNGVDGKFKYSNMETKEDFLLILKLIYSFNSFPKMLYFDMYNEAEDGVEKDFQDFVNIYDSLGLSRNNKFEFNYNFGLLTYTYYKDNKKYTFIYNVSADSKEDVDLSNIIYPKNFSEKILKPFTSLIKEEAIYEAN